MEEKIKNILIKALDTDFVETSYNVLNQAVRDTGLTSKVMVDSLESERKYSIIYYTKDEDILGSWEPASGKTYIKSSFLPEREEGWYKARIIKDYVTYNGGRDCVVYYNSVNKKLSCKDVEFDLEHFEWIDDKPIEFPES